MKHLPRLVFGLVAGVLISVILSGNAYAATGSLRGSLRYTDPVKGSQPCPAGSIVDIKRDGKLAAKTDNGGFYNFPTAEEGTYTLSVVCKVAGNVTGFNLDQHGEVSGVVISAGSQATANILFDKNGNAKLENSGAPTPPPGCPGGPMVPGTPGTQCPSGGTAGGANPDPADSDEGDEQKCAVEAASLGWILCPIIKFASSSVQKISDSVIRPLLTVQPLDPNTQKAWAAMRNLSNIAFILIFLVIIFANTLSLNIDAYTIKKTLPRLVAAAILVQFSFLFMSLFVDLGNVLGQGIGALIQAAVGQAGGVGNDPPTWAAGIGAAVSGAIGFTALAVIGVPTLVLLAGTALIGMLGAALTLIVRQLLITVLIIAAPLAIAAAVLPNTEGYFKFWYKNFTKLILMYPLIMLLLSVGKVLSLAAGTNTGGTINQIIAGFSPVVALLMIPAAFKMSGSMMAGISNAVVKRTSGAKAKLKSSEFAKEAAQKRKDNIAGLAAGHGVGFAGKNLFGGSSKAPKLTKGFGTAIGRAATLNPSGSRALGNFNRAVSSADKEFENSGIKGNFDAMEMISMSDQDFEAKQNNGTALEKKLASQVKRFRSNRTAQAAATISYAGMGGGIDDTLDPTTGAITKPGLRSITRDRFGTGITGQQVFQNMATANKDTRPDLLFDNLEGALDTDSVTHGKYAGFMGGRNQGELARFKEMAWKRLLLDPKGNPRSDVASIVAGFGGGDLVTGAKQLNKLMNGPGPTVDAKSAGVVLQALMTDANAAAALQAAAKAAGGGAAGGDGAAPTPATPPAATPSSPPTTPTAPAIPAPTTPASTPGAPETPGFLRPGEIVAPTPPASAPTQNPRANPENQFVSPYWIQTDTGGWRPASQAEYELNKELGKPAVGPGDWDTPGGLSK